MAKKTTPKLPVSDDLALVADLQDIEALLLGHTLAPADTHVGDDAIDEALFRIRQLIRRRSPNPQPLGAIPLAAAPPGAFVLNFPKGYTPYGGAGKNAYPSADGTWFAAQCCWGPRGFGVYVFQQRGGAVAKEIPYAGPLMTGRGALTLGGDGILYVHGNYEGANGEVGLIVPGYVRFTSTGPQPVPIPVVNMVEDGEARRQASVAGTTARDARQVADRALAQAQQAFQQAQQRPSIGKSDIEEVIWNSGKVQDLVYFEITNAQSGIRTTLESIIDARVQRALAGQPKKSGDA